jgi:hypothetical protein
MLPTNALTKRTQLQALFLARVWQHVPLSLVTTTHVAGERATYVSLLMPIA